MKYWIIINMKNKSPWKTYLAEFPGTAVLLLPGLSLVIFMFGGADGSHINPAVTPEFRLLRKKVRPE